MASANLDLVRSILAGWERGDFTRPLHWAAPEIEIVVMDGPAPGSSSGVEEMRSLWREYVGAWENYHYVVDEVRQLDAERVLVIFHRRGRGKTSGLELADLQAKGANVFEVRGGKVTRLLRWWDSQRALADVGLSPEANSPPS
jgi:ketosteroid isomerase-like protein